MANEINFTPAQTGKARVWLIEGRARGDHAPAYQSCLAMGGVSQDFGDVTKIECPDPTRADSFLEIGEISGEIGRVTTTLTGRYAMDIASTLLKLAKKQCRSDAQLHMGDCEDPSDFGAYKKVIILESAKPTNFSTDDLSTLESSGRAAVNETSDLSAARFYEVLPMGFAQRAGDLVTNEVVDVVICSNLSCGDCDEEDDGCQKVFAISKQAGGSPGTPPDVIYSVNKGSGWYAHDVDSMLSTEDPTAIACLGQYLVVVSDDSNSLHYALKSEFKAGSGDPSFTEVATGFVAAKAPLDMWSTGSYAFIVGQGGYVYGTNDPTSGVAVLDAGVATTQNLNAVHALSSTFAVAAGDAGVVLFTNNGETWATTAAQPVAAGLVNLLAIWAKNQDEWWVGTSDGRLFETLDAGASWNERTFPGSGTGRVDDIAFATESVVRIAHATTAPRGRILESIAGGYPNTWKVLPLGTASMPLNDRFNAIASCRDDVNFVVGVGLADNATDGIIVVGSA